MDMELRWKKKMNTKCNKENIMKIPTTPKNKKIAQSKSYKSITAIATLHDFILFIYNFLCYTDDDIYIFIYNSKYLRISKIDHYLAIGEY